MIKPLRITFGVDCPPERAFELWTAHTSTWWPTTHTVSGQRGAPHYCHLVLRETKAPGGRLGELEVPSACPRSQ
jgi:hypothetical protein